MTAFVNSTGAFKLFTKEGENKYQEQDGREIYIFCAYDAYVQLSRWWIFPSDVVQRPGFDLLFSLLPLKNVELRGRST